MRLALAIVGLAALSAPARADTYAGGATVTLPVSKLTIRLPDGGSWSIEDRGNGEILNLLGTPLLVALGPLSASSCSPPPSAQLLDPPPPYVPPGGVTYQDGPRMLSCYQLDAGTLFLVTQIPPDQDAVAQTALASIVASARAQVRASAHRVTLVGTGLQVEVPAEATIKRGTGSFDTIELGAHHAVIAVQYKDPCTIPQAMTRAVDPAFWPQDIPVYAATSATEVFAVACAPSARGTVLIAIDYAGASIGAQDASEVRSVIAAIYAAIPAPAAASTSAAVTPAPTPHGSNVRVIWDAAAYIGFFAGETNAGFEHDGVHDNGGVAIDIPVGLSVGLGAMGAGGRGFELVGAWRRVTTMKPWSSYVLTPSYVDGLWLVGPDLGELDGQRVLGVSAAWSIAQPHPAFTFGGRFSIDRISDALDNQASWLGTIEFCIGFGAH